MPPELLTLMERYNQLGRLLPRDEIELDLDDPSAVAEAETILSEMAKVKSQIDAMLKVMKLRA